MTVTINNPVIQLFNVPRTLNPYDLSGRLPFTVAIKKIVRRGTQHFFVHISTFNASSLKERDLRRKAVRKEYQELIRAIDGAIYQGVQS